MQSYPMLINGAAGEHHRAGPGHRSRRRRAVRHVRACHARGTSTTAMAAAAAAFKSWRKDEAVRREALTACSAAIRARVNDFATLLSREQGKPLTAATGEVIGASVWFSYFAKLQLEPEMLLDDDKKRIEVVRKPLGCGRRHHAVELPVDPAELEAGAGIPRRQHGGGEAVAVHAAHVTAARRDAARDPAARACSTSSPAATSWAPRLPAIRWRARSRSPAASPPARRSWRSPPTT